MSGHDEQKPYVIKRIKKVVKHGHHGGSWKIAYADFVTAMMAFFLLMWLLSLLNHYQLAGVAEYFQKPLKEAFKHEGNQKGKDKDRDKDKNKDKNTEKNTEKNTQKFTEKNQDKYTGKGMDQEKKSLPSDQCPMVDKTNLEQIKEELEKKMEADPELSQYKNQLNFIVTADGLKIQLRDLENKPMFSTGRTDFSKYGEHVLDWLAKELNTYGNRVEVIGHTDGAQYNSKGYTNMELSADRANAVRRMLINSGLDKAKVIRVIGVGDNQLLNDKNSLDPANRRIEIIVLTDQAMKHMLQNENSPPPSKTIENPAPAQTSAPINTPADSPSPVNAPANLSLPLPNSTK